MEYEYAQRLSEVSRRLSGGCAIVSRVVTVEKLSVGDVSSPICETRREEADEVRQLNRRKPHVRNQMEFVLCDDE